MLQTSEWWAIQKFGKLRLKNLCDLETDTSNYVEWVCECGKGVYRNTNEVVSGKIKDCGKCDLMPPEWWEKKRFGKLRCENPTTLSIRSEIGITWLCFCGEKTFAVVKDVFTGTVKSCGLCDLDQSNNSYSLCKSEIVAKIQELELLLGIELPENVQEFVNSRISSLKNELNTADEDIMSAAISSHHVMCEAKNMGYNEAFGNDPFIYYALGLVGEAGELTGALLRAIRNKNNDTGKRAAVESELADCIIYAVILAYTTGIDLVRIVNEKARIVEARARAGYYGPPIKS